MADEFLELSRQELEDIKDDVRYKEKTTLTLKHLCKKMDNLNGVCDDVKSLKTHRSIHWFLIGCILVAIVTFSFRAFAR